MNLNKIVKQLQGKNRYVVINLGGGVHGFESMPQPVASRGSWLTEQGTNGIYLATLAGTFTNWREMVWDFTGEQVIADCKPLISHGKHIHHDIIQKWKENPDLRILSRRTGSRQWFLAKDPTWLETNDYMIDPARKVQMGGDVFFYTALTEVPEDVDIVWFSSIAAAGKATPIEFLPDTPNHQRMLKNGILHLTKENAVLMTDALYTITRVK